MSDLDLSLLLALLLAHTLGDFVFQSDRWVHEKQRHHFRAPTLYGHALIHAGLSAGMLLAFGKPWVASVIAAMAVGLSHAIIDGLKSYGIRRPIRYFLLDQALHVAVIIALWWWLTERASNALAWNIESLWQPSTLLVALAYLVVLRPASILIALIMRRWSQGVDTSGTLADAGARIGMLERFLILTFVLSHQLAAIGFLLTAKSVLRFGDLYEDRDRKLTEYVLLGTMLSFSITLTLGLMTRYGLSLL